MLRRTHSSIFIKTDLMKKKPIGFCKVGLQNITVIYGLRVDESGENG